MSRCQRFAVLLAVLLVLGASAASALPRQAAPRTIAVSFFWDRLAGLWLGMTSVFLKNGSGIDPFGVPAPAPNAGTPPAAGTEGENGSGIDPFGGR